VRDDPAILLPALIESGFTNRPAAFLRTEFPTSLTYLEQLGALKFGSKLNVVWCTACNLDHDAVVEIDLAGKARHFCPEAGWVEDNEGDLASLYLDREWLLDWLQRMFSVLPPCRRRTLVGDHIWHIGEAVLATTSVMIVLSRGSVRAAEVSAALAQVPPLELGIVVTTAAEVPAALFNAHGYTAVNLDQILLSGADGLAIDQRRFAGFIRAFARKTGAATGRSGGRPSEGTLILDVFRARRARKVPYRRKSTEAKDIISEWPDHHPEVYPPGYSTIRRHIPDPKE
jgi:hypothetical protein